MRCLAIVLALSVAVVMAEDESPLKKVSASTSFFSTKFFKEIAKEKPGKNLISSPLSADVVLAMASFGASGNTLKQMRDALALPADDEVSRTGYKSLVDEFANVPNVTLELANKMYVSKDLTLKPEYKQMTTEYFRSAAGELDNANPPKAAEEINSWVIDKTHGKIKDIVNSDSIDAATRMILLNAVYFKGEWAKKFREKNTQDRTFHLNAKTEKKVPTMYTQGDFHYGELPDLKAKYVEIPYKNKDLKMVIIVPDEIEGLQSIIDNLESFNSTRLSKSGYSRDVQLYLPKFKIESEIDLNEPLKRLGMEEMFTNSANFGGISDEPLKVAEVKQKAFIEVNEEGSEAAAVTDVEVSMRFGDDPVLLLVDRPSAFMISHGVGRILLKMALESEEDPIVLQVNRPFYFVIKSSHTTFFQGQISMPEV